MFIPQVPRAAAASLIAFACSLNALELSDIDLLSEVTEELGDVTEEIREETDALIGSGFETLTLGEFPALRMIFGDPIPEEDAEFNDEDITEPDMIESEVNDAFETNLQEADRPLATTGEAPF